MNLTPLDIRKQAFKKKIFGIDPIEVNAFLEMIANELESQLSSLNKLKSSGETKEKQLAEYQKMDKDLRNTLIMVNQLKEKGREEAEKEAKLIITQAEIEAEKLIAEYQNEKQKLVRNIELLKSDQENLQMKLKSMAESMNKFLHMEEADLNENNVNIEALADKDDATLLQNRLNLLRDIRTLQKEKTAFITRLKNLLDMQIKMLEIK